jgi:hypothetical protein
MLGLERELVIELSAWVKGLISTPIVNHAEKY